MATNDPGYVRLANRLTGGMIADVDGGSGWSIAGLDVRKFPKDNSQAARFVRQNLVAGKLENASKAEWDEAHDQSVEEALAAQDPDWKKNAGHQEAQLQRAAQKATDRLREKLSLDEEAEYERFLEWREADLKERLDSQDDSDDPEEQVARTNPSRKTAASRGKKTAKKAKADASA